MLIGKVTTIVGPIYILLIMRRKLLIIVKKWNQKYEVPKRKLNINKLSNSIKQIDPNFDPIKVRFSNDLELVKPSSLSNEEGNF